MNELDGRFAARQIPGQRDYQEDDYGLLDGRDLGLDGREHSMLLVADGMGGHVGGATASGLLSKTFVEAYSQATGPIVDRLRTCLDEANAALASAIAENPELDSMGSTLVAAVVSGEGLNWISVGDSPLWLFRGEQLERLNADHSMAPVLADLVATGRMTAEEAAQDSSRHSLRSAVMGDDIAMIDVSSQPVTVQPGDRVLLASDGLMTLSDQEISAILVQTQDAPLEDSVAALIQAVEAADHPHQDNTTVLLYEPAEGTDTELGAAAQGAGEAVQDKPRSKRWGRVGLLGVLLCVVVALGAMIYWFEQQGESVPVEMQAAPAVEPAEEAAPASQEEATEDSEKAVLDEPQTEKEERVGAEEE